MAERAQEIGFAPSDDRDIAVAFYALLQSTLTMLAEKQVISRTDGWEIYRRASEVLRRRSDEFEGAADILDQEALFWRPAEA